MCILCFLCPLCCFPLQLSPSVLWCCWLGLLTCKNRLPYNLYCVDGDVKHCSTNQPFDAHCCHMGTAIKHPVPDRVKPSFVIFDTRAPGTLSSGLPQSNCYWRILYGQTQASWVKRGHCLQQIHTRTCSVIHGCVVIFVHWTDFLAFVLVIIILPVVTDCSVVNKRQSMESIDELQVKIADLGNACWTVSCCGFVQCDC